MAQIEATYTCRGRQIDASAISNVHEELSATRVGAERTMHKFFSRRDGATYLLAMTVAGMTSACMLTTNATVPEAASPKENPPVQPTILCKADQNVESADCLQRLQGLVAREGDVLRLNLENGKIKTYTGNAKACESGPDQCAVFLLAAFYPSLQSFLVLSASYECGDYELVSRRSGSILKLSAASRPELSPTGKYFVSVDQSDACDRPYDLAIWSTGADPPVQEFKYQAKRYENWTVAGWVGDDRIKLTVFVNDREGSFDQEAEAVRSEKGWKLVWGKRGRVQLKP
jgi:hypothetical protein